VAATALAALGFPTDNVHEVFLMALFEVDLFAFEVDLFVFKAALLVFEAALLAFEAALLAFEIDLFALVVLIVFATFFLAVFVAVPTVVARCCDFVSLDMMWALHPPGDGAPKSMVLDVMGVGVGMDKGAGMGVLAFVTLVTAVVALKSTGLRGCFGAGGFWDRFSHKS